MDIMGNTYKTCLPFCLETFRVKRHLGSKTGLAKVAKNVGDTDKDDLWSFYVIDTEGSA